MTDKAELRRIRSDAGFLNEELDKGRNESPPGSADVRSWEELFAIFTRSERFKNLSESRKKAYRYQARRIFLWEGMDPSFRPAEIDQSQVADFLSLFDGYKHLRLQMRNCVNVLMKQAVGASWRSDNPAQGLPWTKPATRVDLWEQSDVDRLSDACDRAGQPGLAALIVAGFEVGQRVGDLRKLKHGFNYHNGVCRLVQSKTQERVSFPVAPWLQGIIAGVRKPDSAYLFVNEKTGTAFEAEEISTVFAAIRDSVLNVGDPILVLRALRHSCIVQLARAGANEMQIASVTGHSLASVFKVLEVYCPRDNVLAWQAMSLREKKRGGEEIDPGQFGDAESRWSPPKEVYRPFGMDQLRVTSEKTRVHSDEEADKIRRRAKGLFPDEDLEESYTPRPKRTHPLLLRRRARAEASA